MYCDLHTHSTASDGTDRPETLGTLAKAVGLSAVALTDHDTTDGLMAAAAGCAAEGVGFVPGIELSVDPGPRLGDPVSEMRSGTLHVLGLFVEADDPVLMDIRDRVREARDERNPRIVEKLQGLGVGIEYAEVEAYAAEQGTAIIGRPHIGQVLVDKGVVGDMREAFKAYLGAGRPAYVRRDPLPADEAIGAVHHAGGLAIVAHPVQLKYEDPAVLREFVAKLAGLGLDGIEVHHSDHTASHCRLYEAIAREQGLLVSGGSDYHGTRKAVALGSERVPIGVYERLREAKESR